MFKTKVRQFLKAGNGVVTAIKVKVIGSLSSSDKRIIVLSSLVGNIKKLDFSDSNKVEPSKELLIKIDELLKLTKYDQGAMLAPMWLAGSMWEKIHNQGIKLGNSGKDDVIRDLSEIVNYRLTAPRCNFIARQLARMVPEHLRYDSNNKISTDIGIIIANMDKILSS